MCMRKRYGRELLWIPNLVVLGVGGVLLIPWAIWGWAMEEYYEWLEGVF